MLIRGYPSSLVRELQERDEVYKRVRGYCELLARRFYTFVIDVPSILAYAQEGLGTNVTELEVKQNLVILTRIESTLKRVDFLSSRGKPMYQVLCSNSTVEILQEDEFLKRTKLPPIEPSIKSLLPELNCIDKDLLRSGIKPAISDYWSKTSLAGESSEVRLGPEYTVIEEERRKSKNKKGKGLLKIIFNGSGGKFKL